MKTRPPIRTMLLWTKIIQVYNLPDPFFVALKVDKILLVGTHSNL